MHWVQSETQLGARIRKWRSRIGFSLEEAARGADTSAERWAAVEEGREALTAHTLHTFAAVLAADPAQLLMAEAPMADAVAGATRFRAEGSLASVSSEDRRLLAVAAEAGRIAGHLSELLVLDQGVASRSVPLGHSAWQQGYEFALEARQTLGVPAGPIHNLVDLLHSRGVLIVVCSFSDRDVQGASVTEPGALPVILLNERSDKMKSGKLMRSVIAHELCHVLFDVDDSELLTNLSRRTDREDDIEKRANAFAPAFLAPPDEPSLGSRDPDLLVQLLAKEWWFTTRGATWHTKNLLHMGEREGTDLVVRHRGKRYSRQDSGDLGSLYPGLDHWSDMSVFGRSLLGKLAARAQAADLITAGRAQEIIALS